MQRTTNLQRMMKPDMLNPTSKENPASRGDSSGVTAMGTGKPKSQGVCILQAFFGQVKRYDTETKSSRARAGRRLEECCE